MKTMTLYIAYDDTEFTDENECRAYEEKAYNCVYELIDAYTFFDKEKNIIFTPGCNDIEEYLYWFEKVTDNCEYVKVDKNLSHEAHVFLWQNIGACVPEEEGFYKYDWDEYKWVSAN